MNIESSCDSQRPILSSGGHIGDLGFGQENIIELRGAQGGTDHRSPPVIFGVSFDVFLFFVLFSCFTSVFLMLF